MDSACSAPAPHRMIPIAALALALPALASCKTDDGTGATNGARDLGACLPQELRGSCVERRMLDYQRCLDGAGACSFERQETGGIQHFRFDWANGASLTADDDVFELHGAAGALCTVTPLEEAECKGVRYTVDGQGFDICADPSSGTPELVYRCDEGEQIAVADPTPPSDLACSLATSMDSSYLGPCVDERGRSFDEVQRANRRTVCPSGQCAIAGACHPEGARDVAAADGCNTCRCSGARAVCTQGACGGEIGARCFDDVPCQEGLYCRNTNVDPEQLTGYCTLACTTAECPAGTECQKVATADPDDPPDQCLRACTSQDDCDRLGSNCSLVRGDSGYCF